MQNHSSRSCSSADSQTNRQNLSTAIESNLTELPELHTLAYKGDIHGLLQCLLTLKGLSMISQTITIRNSQGRNVCGVTPVFLAAQKGHLAAVRLLVDNGASPSAPSWVEGSNQCCTPTEVATLHMHFKIARYLKMVASMRRQENRIIAEEKQQVSLRNRAAATSASKAAAITRANAAAMAAAASPHVDGGRSGLDTVSSIGVRGNTNENFLAYCYAGSTFDRTSMEGASLGPEMSSASNISISGSSWMNTPGVANCGGDLLTFTQEISTPPTPHDFGGADGSAKHDMGGVSLSSLAPSYFSSPARPSLSHPSPGTPASPRALLDLSSVEDTSFDPHAPASQRPSAISAAGPDVLGLASGTSPSQGSKPADHQANSANGPPRPQYKPEEGMRNPLGFVNWVSDSRASSSPRRGSGEGLESAGRVRAVHPPTSSDHPDVFRTCDPTSSNGHQRTDAPVSRSGAPPQLGMSKYGDDASAFPWADLNHGQSGDVRPVPARHDSPRSFLWGFLPCRAPPAGGGSSRVGGPTSAAERYAQTTDFSAFDPASGQPSGVHRRPVRPSQHVITPRPSAPLTAEVAAAAVLPSQQVAQTAHRSSSTIVSTFKRLFSCGSVSMPVSRSTAGPQHAFREDETQGLFGTPLTPRDHMLLRDRYSSPVRTPSPTPFAGSRFSPTAAAVVSNPSTSTWTSSSTPAASTQGAATPSRLLNGTTAAYSNPAAASRDKPLFVGSCDSSPGRGGPAGGGWDG